MYSKNRDQAYVLYVTDEKDNVVPLQSTFNVTGPMVKKHHDAILAKLKREGKIKRIDAAGVAERALVAEEVLTRLQSRVAEARRKTLRLYRKTWELRGGVPVFETILLGEK